jgi:hypothetical protein
MRSWRRDIGVFSSISITSSSSGVKPFVFRQITVEAFATLLRKGYETSKSATYKF